MWDWLKRWWKGTTKVAPHRHDYEMVFEDPEQPLAFRLKCACGDYAPTMDEALRRMGR